MKRKKLKFFLVAAALVGGFYVAQIVRYTAAGLAGHGVSFHALILRGLERQGFVRKEIRLGANPGFAAGCSIWYFEPDRKACFELGMPDDAITPKVVDGIRKTAEGICSVPHTQDEKSLLEYLGCEGPASQRLPIKISLLTFRDKQQISKQIIEIKEIK